MCPTNYYPNMLSSMPKKVLKSKIISTLIVWLILIIAMSIIFIKTDKVTNVAPIVVPVDLYALPSVTEAQEYLKKIGYYNGSVDGIVGDKFRHSYEAYSNDYDNRKK